jgi:hypothetical protein
MFNHNVLKIENQYMTKTKLMLFCQPSGIAIDLKHNSFSPDCKQQPL